MNNLSKMSVCVCLTALIGCLNTSTASAASAGDIRTADKNQSQAYQYLTQLTSPSKGIGAREAGTKNAAKTAYYIENKLSGFGYSVTLQEFSFEEAGKRLNSKNIIADSSSPLNPTIILAAHYDSTAAAKGSMGATDNGAGVAAMLAIAQALSNENSSKYNLRFIAFGAEEVGLKGSNYYVESLIKQQKMSNVVAMINFDTIAGGDHVYVHSAHTTPYENCDKQKYSSQTNVRDGLLNASIKILGEKAKYVIHPDYEEYPAGVTGSWSDHASFACAGIPIAYVESTNFALDGKNGRDGYSQTTTKGLWTCYDEENQASCDRKKEKKWGEIWHTQYDTLDALNNIFPGRVENQIEDNVKVLIELLSHPEMYL